MKSLRRRWVVTTVMLVLTLTVSVAAYAKLPATYQAKSNVIVLPSQDLAKGYGGNPYLAFNSTLNQTADMIRYEVTDLGTAQSLQAGGYTQGYTITDAFDTAAPVLLITVSGKDKAGVEHTLSGVTQEISTKLTQQQASIPSYDRIRTSVISFTSQPTAVSSKKLRSLMIVVAICLLFTFAVPIIIDTIVLRRQDRREARVNRGADEETWQSTTADLSHQEMRQPAYEAGQNDYDNRRDYGSQRGYGEERNNGEASRPSIRSSGPSEIRAPMERWPQNLSPTGTNTGYPPWAMKKSPVDELVDHDSLHHHDQGLRCFSTMPRCRCRVRPRTMWPGSSTATGSRSGRDGGS